MKSLKLILLLSIVPLACKKDKTTPEFRKAYAGTYTATRYEYRSVGPGGRFGSGDTSITETLTVSYKTGDSVECYDYLHKKPALMFRFDHDSMKVGVDPDGRLYIKAGWKGWEAGGFVSLDSISYTWSDVHSTRSERYTLNAKRKK